MNDYLTAQQVVVMLGISENTLNFWYRFKKENPDNEVAQLLPEYTKETEKSRRLWKRSDLDKLIKFQQTIPKGRNGIMSGTTQRYYKKKKEEVSNGKKGHRSRNTAGRNKGSKAHSSR